MPFATKLNCEEKIPFYANTAGFLPLLPYQTAKIYLFNSELTGYCTVTGLSSDSLH